MTIEERRQLLHDLAKRNGLSVFESPGTDGQPRYEFIAGDAELVIAIGLARAESWLHGFIDGRDFSIRKATSLLHAQVMRDVERLREQGWEKADFAQALRKLLMTDEKSE